MKKTILILSILALNVFAITCRDYIQYSFHYTLSTSPDIIIDSAYVANGGYDYIYYSPLKYHYTNNTLDSIVRCVGGDCWTLKIKTLTERTDSTLKVTQFINDWKSEKTIFLQKDSAVTYSYSDEEDKLETIDNITTIIMHNDTVYEKHEPIDENDDKKSKIMVPDPDNDNACNITETVTTSYGKSDTTKYQEIITNTENGFVISASNTDEKIFFVYTNGSTTTIQRKIRPALNYKKAKHFDLLGRPAMGKYTVDFLK